MIPSISTGDIFRANVAEGTKLGLEVKRIMAEGGYVSDDLTNEIVAHRLVEDDATTGWLLDGYPRTLSQVEALDRALAANGKQLDAVISLQADIDEVVARLHKRAVEENREDDTPEAIRARQQKYLNETSPLLDLYRSRGLLIEVDGVGSIDDVAARVMEALESHPHLMKDSG
jgi:adenylate kinase